MGTGSTSARRCVIKCTGRMQNAVARPVTKITLMSGRKMRQEKSCLIIALAIELTEAQIRRTVSKRSFIVLLLIHLTALAQLVVLHLSSHNQRARIHE